MSEATRIKQPTEVKTLVFDYAGPPRTLATGDTLTTSAAATITSDSTGSITLGSPTTTGDSVKVQVSGGLHGDRAWVQCSKGTTLGDTLNLDVRVHVLEHEN